MPLAFSGGVCVKDLSKEEYKTDLKEYKERGNAAFKKSRNNRIEKRDREAAYREHLECAAMIRNMNYKMKNDEWLYDDRPNGSFIKFHRVIASGDPDKIGKLFDNFGREVNVPRKTN